MNPSDNWGKFTNSAFEKRHLTPEAAAKRRMPWYITSSNIIKLYVGIAFISTPCSIKQVGLYGAAIGFSYVVGVNIFCIYLLLKARNRFKRDRIIDIGDLADKLYGGCWGPLMSILLVLTNSIFLVCYIMFFGTQTD